MSSLRFIAIIEAAMASTMQKKLGKLITPIVRAQHRVKDSGRDHKQRVKDEPNNFDDSSSVCAMKFFPQLNAKRAINDSSLFDALLEITNHYGAQLCRWHRVSVKADACARARFCK
jgi:hypothetical protein